eukprot:5528019-Pleurochrysis_carterae.AAC.1
MERGGRGARLRLAERGHLRRPRLRCPKAGEIHLASRRNVPARRRAALLPQDASASGRRSSVPHQRSVTHQAGADYRRR